MVKIRLARGGAKKRPHYRIVAMDQRKPTIGRPLEYLGTYDPCTNPEKLDIRFEQVETWVAKGAQLSPTVASLIQRARTRADAVAS
jgi:small subunit ribosomal protein S16